MENEIEIATNKVPSYKVEGYIAFFFGLYCLIIFVIRLFGNSLHDGYEAILYSIFFPFSLFLGFKSCFVFNKLLNEKLIAKLLLASIILELLGWMTTVLPFLISLIFHHNIYLSNPNLATSVRLTYKTVHYSILVLAFLKILAYWRYKSVMKGIILLWIVFHVAFIFMFFFLENGNFYLYLLSGLGSASLSYFFFNLKKEMKNLELKNSAISDPEIIDQI